MRASCITSAAILLLIFPCASTIADNKPLGEEEKAVYRDFLEQYLGSKYSSREKLRLANKTTQAIRLDCIFPDIAEQLPEGFPKLESIRFVDHRISAQIISKLDITFINPHKRLSKTDHNGILFLSPIVFDQNHQTALLAYEYRLPTSLHGEAISLKKVSAKWIVGKIRCHWNEERPTDPRQPFRSKDHFKKSSSPLDSTDFKSEESVKQSF